MPSPFTFLKEVVIIGNKNERITFRINSKELKTIESNSKKANMMISEYVRYASLNKEIVVIEDLKIFTKDLRAIGINLNQLTILCYQGKITCPNIYETKEKVNEIWRSLNLLMGETKKRED